jgi:hypothetical protein
MKRFLFKVYDDNRGNEYSHTYICMGVPKEVSPHIAEDDKFHLLEGNKKLGLSVCDECLNIRRLKKYPK